MMFLYVREWECYRADGIQANNARPRLALTVGHDAAMTAQDVLDFWFGADRKAWFEKNPAFDAEIRSRFLPLYERAAAGALQAWREDPTSCLALVILLDQFPRNMFRGSARAFAADALAREAARTIVERGWDKSLSPDERTFVYLPFEHSEALEDQELAMRLFEGNPNFEWARKHWEIIRRFGRFPHRNAALGRESTPEEIAFLKEPGSNF
jgi:uncharacterized protein (DUF924 family)